jgi:hypothetical protein
MARLMEIHRQHRHARVPARDSETIKFLGSISATRLLAVRLLIGGERLEYDYFPVDIYYKKPCDL